MLTLVNRNQSNLNYSKLSDHSSIEERSFLSCVFIVTQDLLYDSHCSLDGIKSHETLGVFQGQLESIENSRSHYLSRADRVLNSFTPIHYGTFGGLPTRILYIFVGLSPTILLITGFTMWRLRKKDKTKSHVIDSPELVHHS